jgi:hypothetical protein
MANSTIKRDTCILISIMEAINSVIIVDEPLDLPCAGASKLIVL